MLVDSHILIYAAKPEHANTPEQNYHSLGSGACLGLPL
jgi:hypothetical protein